MTLSSRSIAKTKSSKVISPALAKLIEDKKDSPNIFLESEIVDLLRIQVIEGLKSSSKNHPKGLLFCPFASNASILKISGHVSVVPKSQRLSSSAILEGEMTYYETFYVPPGETFHQTIDLDYVSGNLSVFSNDFTPFKGNITSTFKDASHVTKGPLSRILRNE